MAESMTLHRCRFTDDWQPLAVDVDGDLFLIGEDHEAQQLHDLLAAYLAAGTLDDEIVSEFDPAWTYMKPMFAAVQVVRETAPAYAVSRTDDQIGNSLRAAARRGTITAASQDDAGNWYFRLPAVRGWAIRQRDA